MWKVSFLGLVLLGFSSPVFAQKPAPKSTPPAKPDVKAITSKGLAWLVKNQNKDGSWPGYPSETAGITAYAGLALMMEGSTNTEGVYHKEIAKTVDWLLANARPSGLLGATGPKEDAYSLPAHAMALTFLSQVYAADENKDRRAKLAGVLDKAIAFTAKSASHRGAWAYLSSAEYPDGEEVRSTAKQILALAAARDAGLTVPKDVIDRGMRYILDGTTPNGGVVYSHSVQAPVAGIESPEDTIMAISAAIAVGRGNDETVKGWLKYVRPFVPTLATNEQQFRNVTPIFTAHMAYRVGEDGYAKLMPTAKEGEVWKGSSYRDAVVKYLAKNQKADGSWTMQNFDQATALETAQALIILQLDNGFVPAYQR